MWRRRVGFVMFCFHGSSSGLFQQGSARWHKANMVQELFEEHNNQFSNFNFTLCPFVVLFAAFLSYRVKNLFAFTMWLQQVLCFGMKHKGTLLSCVCLWHRRCCHYANVLCINLCKNLSVLPLTSRPFIFYVHSSECTLFAGSCGHAPLDTLHCCEIRLFSDSNLTCWGCFNWHLM